MARAYAQTQATEKGFQYSTEPSFAVQQQAAYEVVHGYAELLNKGDTAGILALYAPNSVAKWNEKHDALFKIAKFSTVFAYAIINIYADGEVAVARTFHHKGATVLEFGKDVVDLNREVLVLHKVGGIVLASAAAGLGATDSLSAQAVAEPGAVGPDSSIEITSLEALELEGKAILSPGAYAFVARGAGEPHENRRAFADFPILTLQIQGDHRQRHRYVGGTGWREDDFPAAGSTDGRAGHGACSCGSCNGRASLACKRTLHCLWSL
jgi:hypothetical protein